MALLEVKVPDIGDFKDVEVIELLVKPGDSDQGRAIARHGRERQGVDGDSVVGRRHRPRDGIKIGDKVSEGSALLMLETEGAGEPVENAGAPAGAAVEQSGPASPGALAAAASAHRKRRSGVTCCGRGGGGAAVEVVVPDIGDFDEVAVIEVMVKPGDTVKVEQSLITVESDKASMEIPSSHAGVVKEVVVKIGDKVSKGTPVVRLEGAGWRGRARTRSGCRCRAGIRAGASAAPRTSRCAGCRREGAADRRVAGARADRAEGRIAACVADDPQARARARRAARGGEGQRSEGPHHAGGRAGLRQAA